MRVLLKMFLFLLPWQTIWIFREVFVGGMKMEWLMEGFYVTEGLLWVVIILFILWYWSLFRAKFSIFNFQFSKDRIFVFSVFLFSVFCLLSIFWTYDRSLALQQSLHIIEAFLLFFVLWLGPLKKEDAIKWLVLGSVLPCILGIWQFLAQSTFASTWLGLALHPAWQGGTSVVASETIGRWLRAYGSFSHPNVFGGYLVIVLMCLVMEHGAWNMEHRTKSKIVFYVVCSMLCVVLFFTFSRSAWVAAVVLLIYHITQTTKPKLYSVLLCCLSFVFLIALFFPLVQTRFTGNSISESHSISDRVSGYSDAWKLFKQNPVLGVGVGNYTIALWHSDKWRPAWEVQPVHNTLVLFVVETGVVGVLLLLFVIISFLKLTTQTTKHKFYYGLCCLSFVFLLSFDHYLYSSYTGLMLSALFFALISRRNNENTVSPQLVHCESFDTQSVACHNTGTRLRPPLADYGEAKKEPIVGAGA